jgi:hypothetical protein
MLGVRSSQDDAVSGPWLVEDFAVDMEGGSFILRCNLDGCSWRQAVPPSTFKGDEISWDPAIARQLGINHGRMAHTVRPARTQSVG